MTTVTVSEEGQVIIPDDIRQQLGIIPGCQLDMTLEGHTIRVEVRQAPQAVTAIDDGFGMLVCPPGKTKHLSEFDVAKAMRNRIDDCR